MSFVVFREHLLPDGDIFYNMVSKWYNDALCDTGILPSNFDVNYKIRKRWKREDIWAVVTIPIYVPTMEIQMQAMLCDSMEQSWLDKKPKGAYLVHGVLTDSQARCLICLEQSGDKIRLTNCKCLYHKKCIETWARYGNSCPKCLTTINMSNEVRKRCNDANENENVKAR